MASFLSRYQDGEHTEVWAELQALGAQIREEPLYSDALAVAQETMRRVRYNIELLIPRLTELGYRFFSPTTMAMTGVMKSDPPVFSPPAANVDDLIARIEQDIGPLPLALKAFYQVVGGVNLEGWNPHWQPVDSLYDTDPLEVWPLDEAVIELMMEDHHNFLLYEGEDRYRIPIAPDYCHKSASSGGGPYEIAVPDLAVDAPLLNEWHNTTFVSYLRISFELGGMPGLDACSKRPGKDLAYLTRGFLLF